MTVMQRIRNVFIGIVMIICASIISLGGEEAYELIILIYGGTLLFNGITRLIYYFTMTRYMVDGKTMLYIGVIFIDFGIFTFTLTDVPIIYLILYVLGIHAFSGLVDILRALETKKYGGTSWKLNFSYGVANILMALLCIFLIKTPTFSVYVYCLGIVYSGIIKIVNAFRRTAVVYIQ